MATLAVLGSLPGLLTGCVQPSPAAPAEMRTTAPPWDAPRDAVSYIEAAGLEPLPLDLTDRQSSLVLRVVIDDAAVEVPAYVGIDRPRAVQAAAHTHDATGTVWLEGKGSETVTVGQFFVLWGVRLDARCLGATCGRVTVTVDGVHTSGDPTAVRLAGTRTVSVAVTG